MNKPSKALLIAALLLLPLGAFAQDCGNPPQGQGPSWQREYEAWCKACGGTFTQSGGISSMRCDPGPNWGGSGSSSSGTVGSTGDPIGDLGTALIEFWFGWLRGDPEGDARRQAEQEAAELKAKQDQERKAAEEVRLRDEQYQRLKGSLKGFGEDELISLKGMSTEEALSLRGTDSSNELGLKLGDSMVTPPANDWGPQGYCSDVVKASSDSLVSAHEQAVEQGLTFLADASGLEAAVHAEGGLSDGVIIAVGPQKYQELLIDMKNQVVAAQEYREFMQELQACVDKPELGMQGSCLWDLLKKESKTSAEAKAKEWLKITLGGGLAEAIDRARKAAAVYRTYVDRLEATYQKHLSAASRCK